MFWTWRIQRGKPGRLAVSLEVRAPIHRMSRENSGWGAPRIHGELLKLAIDGDPEIRDNCHHTSICPTAKAVGEHGQNWQSRFQ
jgi:hypothetical protein